MLSHVVPRDHRGRICVWMDAAAVVSTLHPFRRSVHRRHAACRLLSVTKGVWRKDGDGGTFPYDDVVRRWEGAPIQPSL